MNDASASHQTDLTHLTKAELINALQAQQTAAVEFSHLLEQQARLLELSYDAIFVWEWGGVIKYWNPAAAELYGWTREEALGKFSNELLKTIHPEGWDQVEEVLLRDGHWYGELIHQTRDGRQLTVDSRHVLVCEEGGRKLVLETNRDLTSRKQTEQALRESEARLSRILNSAMDAIISVNAQQQIVLFNAAAERMFGYTAKEVLGQSLNRFIPTRFQVAHEDHIGQFGQTGETSRAMGALNAICGVRRNGEEFPIEASISQIEIGGQQLFTVILRDITERLRVQERLVEQAALLDQSLEAIVVRDMNGRIQYWSRGAERLYGWQAEEVIGRTTIEILYGEDKSQFMNATNATIEKETWSGELRQVAKDGREVIVEGHWSLVRDAQGNPKSILAINTDITEKKRLEAQFLRAQRLESIGTLASGIAHDLNNVLSPILMGTQMLRMRLTDEQSLRLITLMESNAQRGSEMVKQVLSFAKGVGGRRTILQPKHLIREIVHIAEETFPKPIRLEQHLAEDLWTVSSDATQLHQVLLNLCVNARDAMPNGGTLTISAENRQLDDLFARMLKGANPGDFVVISVTDTGTGIPLEIIDRIFDPFFTTKESGKGTGLGLSAVQGIVSNYGGFITVESKPGAGSKFEIYFPAHHIADPHQTSNHEFLLSEGAGELVLVIDDEAAIREMTRAVLEAGGYRVLIADNGATALSLFADHRQEIHMVITDLMMPIMDGITTIRALRKISSGIPIIATCGLTASANTAELNTLGIETLLEKPYNAETLLAAITRSLNHPKPSPNQA
ncbi:MAG: PAS domain S-box protein [Acidobacteria bacterium]|nr:PAS domain S-box protein [Acidobacteriota bacterium]